MDLKACENTARKLWGVGDSTWGLDGYALCIDGKALPLMPWRFDRRLTEMRALVERDGALRQLCSYKSLRIDRAGADFKEMLLDELDTCEWLTGDSIASIYATSNGEHALLVIAKTSTGLVCAIDFAATLSKESKPVTRHEIVGVEGLITDRSINEQIPVESLYLFRDSAKAPETFTDMDNSMLGLIPEEVKTVDNIIFLLSNRDEHGKWLKRYDRLSYLVECVFDSVRTGQKVIPEVSKL